MRKYIQFDGDYYFLDVMDDGHWRWVSPSGMMLLITMHKSKPCTSDDWFGWYVTVADPCAVTASHGWTILTDDTEEFQDWDDHSS